MVWIYRVRKLVYRKGEKGSLNLQNTQVSLQKRWTWKIWKAQFDFHVKSSMNYRKRNSYMKSEQSDFTEYATLFTEIVNMKNLKPRLNPHVSKVEWITENDFRSEIRNVLIYRKRKSDDEIRKVRLYRNGVLLDPFL